MIASILLSAALSFAEDGSFFSPVWKSGDKGLWRAEFADKSSVCAAQFPCVRHSISNGVSLEWSSPEIDVRVDVVGAENVFDFSAVVKPKNKTLLSLELPAELRFAPESVRRYVFPNEADSLGVAFNSSFFLPRPEEDPAGWKPDILGAKGAERVFGKPGAIQHKPYVPAALSVTAQGTNFFSSSLVSELAKCSVAVDRPTAESLCDRVLVSSKDGAFLSGSSLGGSGTLWRIGAGVNDANSSIVRKTVAELARKVGGKTALVAVRRGPPRGIWAHNRVDEWRKALKPSAEFAEPRELLAALRSGEFSCIINPYGEALPVSQGISFEDMLDAVRSFVRSGGNWVETGGHSFYAKLAPSLHYSFEGLYPPLWADFQQLDATAGSVALYGVQPRQNGEIFVPGNLYVGGDEKGGKAGRSFCAYILPGRVWKTPVVRMIYSSVVTESLKSYSKDNQLFRPLHSKVSAETLAKLKNAPLVKLRGPCRNVIEALPLLPSPSIIHFNRYLKGGFDKEYPDHMPINKAWGTDEDMRELLSECKRLGHLASPYTNPTWWCDHPRGPTFLSAGEAPLLVNLDGKHSYEKYGSNDGWTTCLWHPAVKEVNRRTVEQFTKLFPVDLLFQDQCGARRWYYDLNPASPTPWAYSEGMLRMNAEDSAIVPIGTENGWDRVADYQTLISGCSWAHLPLYYTPGWVTYFHERYAPETWRMFPIALYLSHENCLFTHHDLGQFIEPDRWDTLVWTLATGYSTIAQADANWLAKDEKRRKWIETLGRLQRTVCSHYAGQPLLEFEHDHKQIVAQYGPVRVIANITAAPRTVEGRRLAPFGFHIEESGKPLATLHENSPLWIAE